MGVLNSPRNRFGSARNQPDVGTVIIISVLACGAIAGGVFLIGKSLIEPPAVMQKPRQLTPEEAEEQRIVQRDKNWTNGPSTYAEALQVWKTEIEILVTLEAGHAPDASIAAQREKVERARYRKDKLDR